MTVENGLIAVYSALKLNTRADGSEYRAVSDMHPDADTVREIVRELHDEELPNDWRYEITYHLAAGLVECSEGQGNNWEAEEYQDYIAQLAENLSDDCSGDLLEWAKIGQRLEFDNELNGITGLSIEELLKLRQEEEITLMGYKLLSLVEEHLT
jgi:hypothetical protein